MPSGEHRGGGRCYKFFRLIVDYTNFAKWMQLVSDLHHVGKFALGDIYEMAIYERDIFLILTEEYLDKLTPKQ